MATIAMLLSDMMGLDTHKVIKMVLMHDLAESIVGDYMPGDVTPRQKLAKEKKAMRLILSRSSQRDKRRVWRDLA